MVTTSAGYEAGTFVQNCLKIFSDTTPMLPGGRNALVRGTGTKNVTSPGM